MLKTISAALLAISVIAAPAFAADAAKTTPAPVAKTTQAPAIKAVTAKPAVMNANAKMARHHHRFHRHHRFHKHAARHMTAKHFAGKRITGKHIGAFKAHKLTKVSVKHVKTAFKHG